MPPTIAPTKIHVEAVQFTLGLDPVIVHYAGKDVKAGPLAKTSWFHTTQADLTARQLGRPTTTTDEWAWGDRVVTELLEAHLAENGITATVVLPEPPAIEPGEVLAPAPDPAAAVQTSAPATTGGKTP